MKFYKIYTATKTNLLYKLKSIGTDCLRNLFSKSFFIILRQSVEFEKNNYFCFHGKVHKTFMCTLLLFNT